MTDAFNATLLKRINLNPELSLFRIAPKTGPIPPFEPGQFATLGLLGKHPRVSGSVPEEKMHEPEKLVRRAYSIASSPLQKDYLEFVIVLVKEGALTPRLWTLSEGDEIYLGSKIAGHFTMEAVPQDKNLIFVATGTGNAPFVSMLGTYLASQPSRKFALLHGVRVSQDFSYQTEMESMVKNNPNFSYHPIISRPQNDPIPWTKTAGHVQALWQNGEVEKAWGFKPTPQNTHFFLCGSPQMIESMISLLSSSGFKEHTQKEAGQIHVERYW
ncbi:ferredoxin--NADP reductase [bacterium]|nr:ferredoxin--NADP reductase [bacterium]